MTQPALIIGLGGTGQWVLTMVKKDLLEVKNGEGLSEVRLLGIDTQIPEVNLTGVDSFKGDDRLKGLTDARIGNVSLDRNLEFLQIGEPLYDKIRNIHNANPKIAHYDWLDTETLIGLGPVACSTIVGAGAYRQLGRLSLFNNVTKVSAQLRNKLSDLRTLLDGRQLQVYIVASIAGGTGSGTFLDLAWLTRAAANAIGLTNYQLSGFIVLPTAWEQNGPSREKRIRSYAAWRELDRFMSIRDIGDSSYQKIVYDPTTGLEVTCDRPVFDITYLFDQNRHQASLSQYSAEDATFPAIAQAISTMLDSYSGNAFSEHLINVMVHQGTSLPRGVYHNSLGTYTVKTPVNYAKQQVYTEMTLAAIERLIEPTLDLGGQASGVRSDRNLEAMPNDLNTGTDRFMRADKHGDTAGNALLPHIAVISGQGTELTTYADQESKKIVDRAGATFTAFTAQITDPTLKPKIDALKSDRVWNHVKPSRDRNLTPAKNKADLKMGIENLDTQWFGEWGRRRNPLNPAIEEEVRLNEGSKDRDLRELKDHLVRNYKALLRNWSMTQLNGIDADAYIAKGGKIGYVIGIYDNILRRIDGYRAYITKLKERIDLNKTKSVRIQNRDSALKNFERLASKECIFAFFDDNVSPKAREAERDYLRRTDKLFEFYLAESVLRSMEQTISEMRLFTEKSKQELEAWVELLAQGNQLGDPKTRYRGIYNYSFDSVRQGTNGLEKELARGNQHFETDRNLMGVEQLIDLGVTNQHYQGFDRLDQIRKRAITSYSASEELKEILVRFVWEVKERVGGACLDYLLSILNEQGQAVYLDTTKSEESIQHNYAIISQYSSKQNLPIMFQGAPISMTLPRPAYYPNTSALAQQLAVNSEPFYQPVSVNAMHASDALWVRFDGSSNLTYAQNLDKDFSDLAVPYELGSVNPNFLASEGVRSDDSYRLGILRLRFSIPSSSFHLYNRLEEIFIDSVFDKRVAEPAQFFTFKAEREGHSYAQRMSQLLRMNYKPLHPEVIALLEEAEKLRLFFLSYAQGILTYTPISPSQPEVWRYSMDDQQVTIFENQSVGLGTSYPIDIFDLIKKWIVGKDSDPLRREVVRINWTKLRERILGNELNDKLTSDKYLLNSEARDDHSIVKIIQQNADYGQGQLDSNQRRFFDSRKYLDLENLAKVIYKERIK